HEREPREDVLAASRERDPDKAAILHRPYPPNEAATLHPVDELDDAVMGDLQPLRDVADGRIAGGQALHGEEQLVLLRLEAGLACRLLAEMKEPPELVSEVGKRPIFADVERRRHTIQLYRVPI